MPKWKLISTIFIFITSIVALEASILGCSWAINIVYGCIAYGLIINIHTMFAKGTSMLSAETGKKK